MSGRLSPEARPSTLFPDTSRPSRVSRSIVPPLPTSSANDAPRSGLVIGARVTGDPASCEAFCAWDPVLRSLLDGRPVYQPGAVTLRSSDGSPLELDQRFRLGEQTAEAAHFLGETGFLLLHDVYTEAEMDEVDDDLARAVDAARVEDGSSWWATTRTGERYPCRILDFAPKSPALRALIADDRYIAIGELLGDGHRPGDPFGEHFADVTAEGLVKRVDSVDGLVCLPWHKDCDRGGHSMFCAGLTIGICLTPVDEAHGGLDVMAGSHRANIARAQIRLARPARRDPARQARRRHRAHVLHAAPLDPPHHRGAPCRVHRLCTAAPPGRLARRGRPAPVAPGAGSHRGVERSTESGLGDRSMTAATRVLVVTGARGPMWSWSRR